MYIPSLLMHSIRRSEKVLTVLRNGDIQGTLRGH